MNSLYRRRSTVPLSKCNDNCLKKRNDEPGHPRSTAIDQYGADDGKISFLGNSRHPQMSRHAHALAHTHKHKHHPKQQPAYVASFVALHTSEAKGISARTGIPVEVILAQSALESNWGRTVKDNAYFGIKGKSATGQSTKFSTHEFTLSGQKVSEVDEFRAYNSYSEAAADYASLIQRRFPAALRYRNDPAKFAEAVARQGYATDPRYAEKLKSIIRSHITPLLGK